MTAAIASLFLAACVSYLLTPLTGRLASRYGVIDHPSQDPSGHKRHLAPTPYLGGIAIGVALVVGALLLMTVEEGIPVKHYVLTLGAAVGLAAVGLLDDIKPLPRSLRLLVQVVVAFVAWSVGFGVTSVGNDLLQIGLTILWIVGVTNAFNLLDNMDGVSAGLAGIAALAFTILSLLNDLPLVPIVSASLAGACLGFLIHNRHPAKVFMGDAGSLMIGFLIALLGIRLRFEEPVEVTFLVPIVILYIPILDTTLVVISRILHRRPVFLGARDHMAHRLVAIGLGTRAAVRLLYVVAGSLASIGIAMSESTPAVARMLTALLAVGGAVALVALLRVEVYPAAVEPLEPADIAPAHLEETSI